MIRALTKHGTVVQGAEAIRLLAKGEAALIRHQEPEDATAQEKREYATLRAPKRK